MAVLTGSAPEERDGGVSFARYAWVLGAMVVFGACLVLVLRTSNLVSGVRYFLLPDDDMITMRYARNLVAGNGAVWNAGERVQGYTNPGWMLVMALVHACHVSEALTSLPLQVASAAMHAATALYVGWRTSRVAGPLWGAGALALYGFSACGVHWGVSGWETSGVALAWAIALDPLVVATCAPAGAKTSARSAMWTSCSVAGLAVLLRPDSGILLLTVAAYWLYRGRLERRALSAIASILVGAALPVAMVVLQRWYYGSWAPNTALLKRSTGLPSLVFGSSYLLRSVGHPFNLFVLGAAVAFLLRRWKASRSIEVIAISALIGVVLVYVVVVGGDAFTHARFVLPLLPTATILAFRWSRDVSTGAVATIDHAGTRFPIVSVTVAAVLLATCTFDFAEEALVEVAGQKQNNRSLLITAFALRDAAANEKPLVGVFMAGTISYLNPDLRFHDMLGKCDPRIARGPAHSGAPGHNRWDFDYSLNEVRPDVIITAFPLPANRPSQRTHGFALTRDFHVALFDDAAFDDHYGRNRMPLAYSDEPVVVFEAYARDDGKLGHERRVWSHATPRHD